MTRKIKIAVFLLLFAVSAFSQHAEIKIEVKNKPLNEVFLMLRDHYGYQFSYSDNLLSPYKITVSKTFSSKEEAVKYLLKGIPFELKKTGDVFIIIPLKQEKIAEKKRENSHIRGQVVEAGSLEPLPFSYVSINNYSMVTDVKGSFNYTASADSTFHLRVSHLGYFIYDTIMQPGAGYQFMLWPSNEKIAEVTVKDNIVEKATLMGQESGNIKLNPTISRFLPGQGDNSVYNFIRLMPGILATGEQSTDLLVWGSYEGQSQVLFDEFSLFGLKNYNDNIGVVNPLLIKNIEIFKGGFDAKYGNRVGGLVNISGKNGNFQKPVFTFNINPTTLNGMVEIPLFKSSSLLVAYRQSYYNLYNNDDFNIFAPTRKKKTDQPGAPTNNRFNVDFDIYPDDYSFRDFNLKYSVNLKNDDLFYISLYGGGDKFVLTADADMTRNVPIRQNNKIDVPFEVTLTDSEINRQQGASAFYGKNWKNGNSSVFILSHSGFSQKLSASLLTKNLLTSKEYNNDLSAFENQVKENSFRYENIINLVNGHKIETGGGAYSNKSSIVNQINLRDTLSIDTTNTFQNTRAYLYLQDVLPIGEKLEIKTGLRANFLFTGRTFHWEPRISASYQINDALKANASWGIYDQFTYKIANVDKDLNYSLWWITANENIPVLKASHSVVGLNYFKNGFTVNVEGYHKRTGNLIRRYFKPKKAANPMEDAFVPYRGDAVSTGLDLFLKKDFNQHAVWISYSLSKTVERLAPLGSKLPDYTLAPHDQRHELKVAGLYNLGKFYFSANYVYGSGMQILKEAFANQQDEVFYSRFDVSATYCFSPWGKNAEIGTSVLNLFDRQNLKYDNIKKININPELGDILINSNAVPFTPSLFLKIIF
jgi:hypothetical protein